jgi:YidC/Oxa1 family membrane protein insertase
MERRVFLAVVLSFVVLYGYQALFVPPPNDPASSAAKSPTLRTTPQPGAASGTAAATATDTPPAGQALVGDANERQVVVETRDALVTLTNRGARVLSWRLKQFADASGAPVDLVPSGLAADAATPFSLDVGSAAETRALHQALYRVIGDSGGRVDATQTAQTVTFEFEDTAGLRATKTFEFEPARFVTKFSAAVSRGAEALSPTILWGPGLGDAGATSAGGSFFTGNYTQPPQAIFQRLGTVERHALDAVPSQPVHEGAFGFVGIDDHYFIVSAVNTGAAKASYQPVTLPGPGEGQRQLMSFGLTIQQPPKGVTFFVGPKQFDVLQSVDPEFVRAINFGMLAWLVVPLLSTLKWLFGFLGNYGWAIITLTIGLNLAMFPLRHKAAVAMRKMQQIQPLMKAIQERYAHLKITDPARQKMNEEISALYKSRGVNPASGCVPTLLTFPVLFAFYSLLSQSIELRGAPFVGWIHDLSAADPYYVLPILMGITMVWQQRLMPATADPAQQRVMMVMPVVFTVTMLFSASGVVLYWFVSQLWAIGQQYFTNWMIGPVTATPSRTPASAGSRN